MVRGLRVSDPGASTGSDFTVTASSEERVGEADVWGGDGDGGGAEGFESQRLHLEAPVAF